MPKKAFSLCALLSLSLCLSLPLYAADQTVFGPHVFTIKPWRLHLSFHRFTVDDPGEGVIVITRATANRQIRGGLLLFNRRPLSLHRFLMGSDTLCEADISLRSTNHLLVFLRGSPGASLSIEVRRKALPPANSSPVAGAQSVTTDEDTPVGITLTGSDPDGDELAYQVASGPTHGTLTGPPPDLTYTPSADYNGPDSFTFQVNDGTMDSEPAEVSVTVNPVNDPPVANDDMATTYQGRPVDIDVLANDTDVDGDVLTVTGVTEAANGSVTINQHTGVTYTPAPGFSDTDSFTYTVTDAHGASATATVTVTVISPITLEITSPPDGALISRADVMVHGTVVNRAGHETGVTVNGMLAIVYGDQFVANHVFVQEADNTIRAVATDTGGYSAETSITIEALPPGDSITITSNPDSGISPLEATLRIEGSFSFTGPSLTSRGPGEVELLDSTPEEYRVRMEEVGIYYLTAEVDYQDITYTDTVAVVVLDRGELDALLKGKWEGMRKALAQNDIDSAISYFDDFSRDAYKETFTALSPLLPQIAQESGDIQFIRVMKNSAEYDIRTVREGKEYSFYLLFVRDKDGLWKIRSF